MSSLWSVLSHYLVSLLSHACMQKHTDMHAHRPTNTHFLHQAHVHIASTMPSCSQWTFHFAFFFFSPSLPIISNFSSKPLREPAAKYGQACVMNFEQPSKAARRSWPLRPCLRLSFRHHFAGPCKEVRRACTRVHRVNPRQRLWPVSY